MHASPMTPAGIDTRIEGLSVRTATIPTDRPESDGTLAWDSTTIVVVQVRAGGRVGTGYTYGPAATAAVVESTLGEVVAGCDAMDVPAAWLGMERAVRNMGRQGIAGLAVSAVDVAL